jgi:hypothetical protein
MTRQDLYPGVIGMEIKADNSRDGVVDDGNVSWPERVTQARRQWTQASPEDFEKIGKRVWRDRASGIQYRQASGAPLLDIGTDAVRFISVFFVLDGKLVFLERADIPTGTVVHHGPVRGGVVVDGQVRWEGSA